MALAAIDPTTGPSAVVPELARRLQLLDAVASSRVAWDYDLGLTPPPFARLYGFVHRDGRKTTGATPVTIRLRFG